VSLEEQIARLTAALERNSDLLEKQVVSHAGDQPPARPARSPKPRRQPRAELTAARVLVAKGIFTGWKERTPSKREIMDALKVSSEAAVPVRKQIAVDAGKELPVTESS
jgi:hypothetical protein